MQTDSQTKSEPQVRCDDGLADKARLDWLETQATQLPEMMGAPRTLHCSVMVAGAETVREAIDACMSANEKAHPTAAGKEH